LAATHLKAVDESKNSYQIWYYCSWWSSSHPKTFSVFGTAATRKM